jgi:hypothetical protein
MRNITRNLGVRSVRAATGVAIAMFASFAIVAAILVAAGQTGPPASVIASGQGGSEIAVASPTPPTTTTTPPSAGPGSVDPDTSPVVAGSDEVSSASGVSVSDTEDSSGEGVSSGAETGQTHITLIGDSVLKGAAPELRNALGPHTVVDGRVNRQFRHADDVARDLRSQGKLGDIVVLHLGTNSPFNSSTWDEVMTELEGVDQVYVLTIQVPRRWESQVNSAIRSGVERWPNVKIIDYFTWGNARPDYYVEDGVHLNAAGRAAYADFIASQVNS